MSRIHPVVCALLCFGDTRTYVWVPGHWTVPPKDYVWVPGHWETQANGTVWVDGQWRHN
jgi:WXXGXW repeat (2 copies)